MSLGAGRLCQRATSHHTRPLYTLASHLRATRREVAGPRPVLTEKCFDGTHAAFCQEKQGNCSSSEPLPVHPRSHSPSLALGLAFRCVTGQRQQ